LIPLQFNGDGITARHKLSIKGCRKEIFRRISTKSERNSTVDILKKERTFDFDLEK
jgi:hypothetical protein